MIELTGIHKRYRVSRRSAGLGQAVRALFRRETTYVEALQDVSFRIADGEMVGYIGPNGAGKSSTVKLMSGILHPDSGTCVINGLVPWRDRKEHVQNIGVVFGQRSQLWWDVPVADSFRLIGDIYHVDEAAFQRNQDELVEMLHLEELIRTPARQLSLGQRMRCEIAASLLHNPKILFLDEPTIGLDAVSKIAVRQFIKRINQEHGTTVILTTHDMQDIEALTQRILLIGKGRILLDGSLEQLKAGYSNCKTLTVLYDRGSFVPIDGITLQTQVDGRAVFTVDTTMRSVSEAIQLLSSQVDIRDLSVAGTSTEELVVSLYQEFQI